MTVDDLPFLNPPDLGNVCDPSRPILSFSWQATGPHRAAAHSHPRAHIIHPEAGACWAVEVAADLGDGSTSSFVYMFRSNLGVSPGRYRGGGGGG